MQLLFFEELNMPNSFRSIGLIARATSSMGNHLFSQQNLQNNQFLYLLHILDSPGITQAELATQLHVDPSTCLRTVRKLITGGYLIRQPDPADKKRKCLVPTEQAHAFYPQLQHYEQTLLTVGTTDFSAGERLMLEELLARVATNIERLQADPTRFEHGCTPPRDEN
ncbi:transcriptional regulator [Levilactobacillus zymae DSM 19395]|nr:transcriptional regulator [Levilactobacillus zymae DSM 19395]